MRKYLYTAVALSGIFLGSFSSVYALSTFITSQGGTGTTTPSGILYGDNGATGHLNTATIGSGLLFSGGTLSATGSGTVTSVTGVYPILSSGGATPAVSTAFGTTTSNTFAGTQTFTNSPVFSTLGAGTVNSTAAGTLYNTSTSTPTVTSPITYSGTLGSFIGGIAGAFNCLVASGSQTGCLSSTDWTTFNGKQAAGNYLTALTGDVTASGPGSAAATLATVNGNVGSFTNANITVNAKGLITAASNGTGTGTGLGTTSPVAAGNLLVYSSTGAGSAFGVGTSTPSLGTGLSYSGTLGSFVGGAAGTLSLTGVAPGSIALPKGNFLVGNDAGAAQATSTIFISSIGNVGIGTTSPAFPLSVSTLAQQAGTLSLLTVASTTNAAIFSVNGNGNIALGNQPSNGGGIYINRQGSSLPAGLIVPNQAITIISDGVTNPNADGADRIIAMYTLRNTANFLGSRFDGTIASPTGVLAGESIVNYGSNVYDGTAFRAQANFLFTADDNIDATNRGTRFDLQLTAASTTGRQTVLRVVGNGGTAIGATYAITATNAIPSGGLIVQGNVGIGLTNPSRSKLELQATTTTSASHGLTVWNSAMANIFEVGGDGSTTASNGFNIIAGCYAINGTCLIPGLATAVTSIATNNGITGGTITTTGTIGLAAIAANSVLANLTGASAVPTALATSSLFNNSSASVTGLLSSTDWSTFNSKYSPIGTTGQFPYFSAPNTLTATSSLFMIANGAIGIGTTTATYGASSWTHVISNAITGLGGLLINTATNVTNALTVKNAAGTNVFNVDTTSANPFFGIGTTTPWATLSIIGNGTNPIFAVATTTNNGLPNYEIDSKGLPVTSGPPTSVSSCGTSTVSGNDKNGQITLTGVALTACTLNFSPTWTSAPDCTVSESSTASISGITSISTSAMVLSFSIGLNSDTIWYVCQQHQ